MKQNLTKQHIWESFYELSATVPFEKLTVEKIIHHSGVSRATFYRHFRDKYDLMNYTSMAVAQRLIGWRKCSSWQEFLYYMFMEIERDKDYFRRAFKTSGQNAHSPFLFEYSYSVAKECYMGSHSITELSMQEHYTIAHYCHGCVDCLEDWLRDPDAISAEEMAALFYKAMPECLRDTWLHK